jgi:TetR/AcrR family transcriptional regulator
MGKTESFLNLPVEKQNTVIDAALMCFGANGYKKTSVKDIADAAGISKAMVFHYFGTKHALFFYLIEYCYNIVVGAVTEKFDPSVTDFFDRLQMIVDIKISTLVKHPFLYAFLNSVYIEIDEAVEAEIHSLLNQGSDMRDQFALEGIDASKFKEGIDPKLVTNILIRMAEGMVSEQPGRMIGDIDVYFKEFQQCVDLFRRNFYKEEYLTQES